MANPSDLFAGLVGQAPATALLAAALDQQRLAPAYLFCGADGVGRSLAARRFLEGVIAGPKGAPSVRRRLEEGNHPDLLWLEPTYQHQGQLIPVSEALATGISRKAPPQLRLEQVRSVSQFLGRRPLESSRCLVVIEMVEAMAEGAANALLKTLEEPGGGLLILLTAAPERLLSTIRSRCQQIPFRRLSPAEIGEVLLRQAPVPSAEPADQGDCEGRSETLLKADPPELLELAAGSPGALLHCREQWAALPEGLAERLWSLGSPSQGLSSRSGAGKGGSPIEALALARDLCEALDGEQQLWLLNWWQWRLWRQRPEPGVQRRLESLRSHLGSYVQPRLAWEVALLELSGLGGSRPA
jgi:DNA polymerase-3 subunit delta'